MKRWLLPFVVVIIAMATALALRSHIRSEARKKREAAYQSALQAYTQNLKPGLTRKEVESYLRAKGTRLTQMCCVDEDVSAFADLVKVGEEDAPGFAANTTFTSHLNSLPRNPTRSPNG